MHVPRHTQAAQGKLRAEVNALVVASADILASWEILKLQREFRQLEARQKQPPRAK